VSRPAPRFHNFIGHRTTVDFLRRQLAGALARHEPFPHVLFLGRSGIGKTLLARSLATEFGTKVVDAMGCLSRRDLAHKLGKLALGDFLLVDEAHQLDPLTQELLTEAIDEHSIPNLEPERKSKERVERRINIPPWTLALATDQPGKLLDALQRRIVIRVELRLYRITELKEIVEVLAANQNLLVSAQGARLLAEVSGGLPRCARFHLQNLRLFFPDSEQRQLGIPEIREFLAASGVDESGLGNLERTYLEELSRRGNASLESMSLVLGTDPAYLRRWTEASLVDKGLVDIASRGRSLTPKESRQNKLPNYLLMRGWIS